MKHRATRHLKTLRALAALKSAFESESTKVDRGPGRAKAEAPFQREVAEAARKKRAPRLIKGKVCR